MEITDLRCVKREGTVTDVDEYYDSRVVRPLDVYEEFNRQSGLEAVEIPQPEDGELPVSHLYLEIETDDDHSGLMGPISESVAYLALDLRDFLVGRDPLQTEKIWDLLYRREVHGRKGERMMAISAIDCALWDIKGKYYDEPVYRLLGGPTRKELPVYVSMFMYDTEPDAVREAAREIQDRGFAGQKWFLQHGPADGEEGKRSNVELAEAARAAVGDDYKLMLDSWMGWDRSYAREMIDRLAPVNPRWLEEPVAADLIDTYADLREHASFPISGGEHEYTRWGVHELLDRNAVDVVQADTAWAGGISELEKICTLGSVHDVPVIPHGHSVPVNVQVSAAQPVTVTPLVEFLIRRNVTAQWFFEEPVEPEDGTITIPDRPGLGLSIDAEKVESEQELTFS